MNGIEVSQGVGENEFDREFDRIVYHTVGGQPLRGLDGTTYTYAVEDAAWEPAFATISNATTTARNISWGDIGTADDTDWGAIFNLENLRNTVIEIENRLSVIENKEAEPLSMDEIATLYEEG